MAAEQMGAEERYMAGALVGVTIGSRQGSKALTDCSWVDQLRAGAAILEGTAC